MLMERLWESQHFIALRLKVMRSVYGQIQTTMVTIKELLTKRVNTSRSKAPNLIILDKAGYQMLSALS